MDNFSALKCACLTFCLPLLRVYYVKNHSSCSDLLVVLVSEGYFEKIIFIDSNCSFG